MSIQIKEGFDFRKVDIDPLEKDVRDQIGDDIENWVKFRHVIDSGYDSSILKGKTIEPTLSIRRAFIDLAKAHYEVVTSMGMIRISLDNAKENKIKNPLVFKKSFKEFYFHCGSILDNLARLIFIVIDKESPTLLWRKKRLMRNWIDWNICKDHFKKYSDEYKTIPNLDKYNHILSLPIVEEIQKIRNNFSHSWPPPIYQDEITKELSWPLAMRYERDYYWPYEEQQEEGYKKYAKTEPIIEMIEKDFSFMKTLQNDIFGLLVTSISEFEKNHDLEIRK